MYDNLATTEWEYVLYVYDTCKKYLILGAAEVLLNIYIPK